jgi:lysophospholipase L1-like esterase
MNLGSSKMVKKVLLVIFQSILSTCLLLLLLEGAFLFLGFPQGASDFIERTILQKKLEFRKPSGQYRLFVYGESTVHGGGYAPFSSPVRWLEVYLQDFLPGRDIEVVNFGRLGEGSAFIAQAFRDTLQYKPDLAIFYFGHNTFIPENRKEFVESSEAEFGNRLKQWLRKSRFFSFLIRETIKLKIKIHSQKINDTMGDGKIETVNDPFDLEKGAIAVPGSTSYLENIQFFKANIEKIIKLGKENRVPVLFMKPVSNLKDYPPNLSRHLKSLSTQDLGLWNQFYQKGREAMDQKNDLNAFDFFEKAWTIDSSYADLAFRLGQLYFQKGAIEKARFFFEKARDNDAIIRRAHRDILKVFDDLADRKQIYYWDTEKALISKTPGGILGWPTIEDNVHFSAEGHALVGRALAEEIAKSNWIAPRSDWRFDREQSLASINKELGITRETVFRNYCSVYSYLGRRYDERLIFAQKAMNLFPEEPIALRQLAWAYWLLGEKGKAMRVYSHLGKKDPAALRAVFLARPEVKQAYNAFVARSANF